MKGIRRINKHEDFVAIIWIRLLLFYNACVINCTVYAIIMLTACCLLVDHALNALQLSNVLYIM